MIEEWKMEQLFRWVRERGGEKAVNWSTGHALTGQDHNRVVSYKGLTIKKSSSSYDRFDDGGYAYTIYYRYGGKLVEFDTGIEEIPVVIEVRQGNGLEFLLSQANCDTLLNQHTLDMFEERLKQIAYNEAA
jgi:hypothetical protein